MPEAWTKIFYHLIWSTWDRRPQISAPMLTVLERSLRDEVRALGGEVVAFGGVEDHVHLVVRAPATISVALLVKQVKGSTSHLMHTQLGHDFKWQGGYRAFTASAWDLDELVAYVRDQPLHHGNNTTIKELEPSG